MKATIMSLLTATSCATIFPLLEKRYPSYRKTFLRAGRHIAEASALLDELAQADSRECAASGKLKSNVCASWAFFAQKNLLRYTFAREGAIHMMPQSRGYLAPAAFHRRKVRDCVTFGNTEIGPFGGLRTCADSSVLRLSTGGWPGRRRASCLPELGGTLTFTPTEGAGISLGSSRNFL